MGRIYFSAYRFEPFFESVDRLATSLITFISHPAYNFNTTAGRPSHIFAS